MKRTIKYLFLLLSLTFFLGACSKETSVNVADETTGAIVRFSVESSLRAVGDETVTNPTDALAREKAINSLYAVIYKTSSGLHYKTVKCTDNGNGAFEFDNEKSGDYHFFLVANPDADLVTKLEQGPTTPEDLGMLVATQTPGEDNTATDFLMTSDRTNVTVTSGKTTTVADAIKMVRLAARFDFYNSIKDLEITKVTFDKRRVESHLFAQVGKMDGIKFTEGEKSYEEFTSDNGLYATVYGYETDIRGETSFTIEATYKGKPIKPEKVTLENFVIKRNHLYNIYLHDACQGQDPADPNKPFGEFAFTIKVADWNQGETAVYDEDNILKPLFVDYKATLSNAPYMDKYLSNSPEAIYTTTNRETTVTITVGGYMDAGTLAFADGYDAPDGVELTEGDETKDPKTGKISHTYTITIPAVEGSVELPLDDEGQPVPPTFHEIPLVAKNYNGATTKEFTIHHGRIKTPLEYVSEHYLAPSPEAGPYTFTDDESSVEEIGYFDPLDFQANHTHFKVGDVDYHLPNDLYEVASILPYSNYLTSGDTRYSIGEDAGSFDNVKEWIVFPCWAYKSAFIRLSSSYRTDKKNKVSYGLRFKGVDKYANFGNLLLTAYRYEWVGDFASNTNGDISSYYKVTTRYMGANWNGSIGDIADEKFWDKAGEDDASRTFYATGSVDTHHSVETQKDQRYIDVNTYAPILSNISKIGNDDAVRAYAGYFGLKASAADYALFVRPGEEPMKYPIRPFSDK